MISTITRFPCSSAVLLSLRDPVNICATDTPKMKDLNVKFRDINKCISNRLKFSTIISHFIEIGNSKRMEPIKKIKRRKSVKQALNINRR